MLQKLKSLIFSKSGKNILIVYSADMLAVVIGFGIVVILIRTLSKSDFGLYTNFMAVMIFIAGTIAGLNRVTTISAAEYISIHKKAPSHIHGRNFILQALFLFLILIIVAPNSANLSVLLFGSNLYSKAILLGVIGAAGFALMEMVRTIFQASEEFKKYGILNLLAQFAVFVGILILWKIKALNFRNTVILWITILPILAGTLLIFLRERITLFLKAERVKELLKGGGWLVAYFLFLSLFKRLDIFMLSRFRGVEEVAVYGVAFTYYSLILLLLRSIHAVFLPKFSKMDYRDRELQNKFIDKWVKLALLTIIPAGILALSARPLMIFLNGPVYLDSVFPFQLFCVGIVLSLIFNPIANILMARKEYFFFAIVGLVVLFINLVGNYLFIPFYGVVGATVVTIVSFAIVNITVYVKARWIKPSLLQSIK